MTRPHVVTPIEHLDQAKSRIALPPAQRRMVASKLAEDAVAVTGACVGHGPFTASAAKAAVVSWPVRGRG